MQTFRARNPKVAIKIGEQLIDMTSQELVERMVCQNDLIYVAIGVDGKEIVGHVVVFANEKERCGFMLSGRIKSGINKEYKEYIMENIQKWLVKEFDIHEIRTDTKIKPEVFARLFPGFKNIMYVMSKTF